MMRTHTVNSLYNMHTTSTHTHVFKLTMYHVNDCGISKLEIMEGKNRWQKSSESYQNFFNCEIEEQSSFRRVVKLLGRYTFHSSPTEE